MELLFIIVLTLLLVPLVVLTTRSLRIVTGLLFLLFLSGYALVAAPSSPEKIALMALSEWL